MTSEQFEKMYELLKNAPTGALKEDLTYVTMKDQFNDSFIRRVAKHLLENGCEIKDS